MITTIKNNDGFVIAYIESTKVDVNGIYDPKGIFIRIENLWVHSKQRYSSTFKRLVKKLNNHPLYKACTGVYWITLKDRQNKKIIDDVYREPVHKHLSKVYPKEKLVNQIIGELKCSKNYSK